EYLGRLGPPLRITPNPDDVVSVKPIWKIKTACGSPLASSVRSPTPDIAVDVADRYRPGVKTNPPTFPMAGVKAPTRPLASLYAMVRAASPDCAAGSFTCIVPLSIPGGKLVTEV